MEENRVECQSSPISCDPEPVACITTAISGFNLLKLRFFSTVTLIHMLSIFVEGSDISSIYSHLGVLDAPATHYLFYFYLG